MNIKESKILLKDFQKGKIEKDKLETYKGGYKLGYFYTVGIQEAIETVLSELEKKDKIIDKILLEMADNHCSIRDIVAEEICDDRCVGNNEWTCFKHIKEYFTNKVEREGK